MKNKFQGFNQLHINFLFNNMPGTLTYMVKKNYPSKRIRIKWENDNNVSAVRHKQVNIKSMGLILVWERKYEQMMMMSSQPKARQEQKLKLAANMIYSKNDLYLWLYLHFSIPIFFYSHSPLRCVLFRSSSNRNEGWW